MNAAKRVVVPKRKDDRVIIHFDYDCFYASVFEAENPALKALPLAVQQKQIIVTCNYEARRRGLHKLQLISEAKKLCPEVVIVLGEQLDRFRDASKDLYRYLEAFAWNKRVERLGFDEVFMDVTDVIAYNQVLLNSNDLSHSFFQLSRHDPTNGFSFDATRVAGHEYPDVLVIPPSPDVGDCDLRTRLILGSHLAQHLRHKLEEEKGYTSTVGISTSKMLAKLVGNLHKPKGETTLMPPYESVSPSMEDVKGTVQSIDNQLSGIGNNIESNVMSFIDSHDIGKIPGIGFKMSHKIRSHVLSRSAQFDERLMYDGMKESVTVGCVRTHPGMGPELLEKLVGGQGAERGIGYKAWSLVNGIDDSEVTAVKKVPSQISIEDSYIRLDNMAQVYKELRILATSLLKRMHIDLLEIEDEDVHDAASIHTAASPEHYLTTPDSDKRWIARPKTIRLTTRPRHPPNPDGTRARNFQRISKSGPLPTFVFNLHEGSDVLVEKLVQETLVPMFRRLHPENQGWNLSLMNIGVTNMVESASDDVTGRGRDIGRMFKRQEGVLKEWNVKDKDVPPEHLNIEKTETDTSYGSPREVQAEPSAGSEAIEGGSEDTLYSTHNTVDEDMQWNADEDVSNDSNRCSACGAVMPAFAMAAHERYHALGDR